MTSDLQFMTARELVEATTPKPTSIFVCCTAYYDDWNLIFATYSKAEAEAWVAAVPRARQADGAIREFIEVPIGAAPEQPAQPD